MTNAYPIAPLYPVFTGLDGKPLEAGYIYIGAAGQNPEASPAAVFWDEDLTIPASQPIRTIAGYPSRNGSPAAIFTAGDFSITVRDRNRVLIYTGRNGAFPSWIYDALSALRGWTGQAFDADGRTGLYPVNYMPNDQSSVLLLVDGVPQEFGRDYTFESMPSAASGFGLRIIADPVITAPVRLRLLYTRQVEQGLGAPDMVFTPQHFGAVGDGVSDDTSAFQAFFSWFGTARVSGPTGAQIPPRRYLLRDRIVCTSNTGFRSWLDWDGAEFICDFDRGAGKYELFYFGDPAAPSDYQAAIDIRGRAYFTRGASCTYPPVAIRAPAWAQSTMQGINAGSWGNTIVDLIGPQNVEFSDWTVYSGGYSFPYLDTSGSLFRQTSSTLSRVSGAFEFPTHCVGKTIEITAGSSSRKTRITARLSATSVTVENSATDSVDQTVYFGSPAVTTTSGSATVTLDGAVTADMVGLLVGIPFAGANQRILWATVVSVNTGAGTLTLDKVAGQTLDPVSNPLTQTTEIATPAVALRSEKIADGGPFINGISQVRFNNLQIETYRGVAVGIDDAEFLHFNQAKCHGISTPTDSIYSCAHLWGNQVGGSWIGEFDQRTMGRWKMVFARQTQTFTFLVLTARTRENEILLGIGPNASGFPGAEINFNSVTLTGIAAATFAALVDDRTSTGGYFPPLRFFVPDGDFSVAAMNRQVSADNTGALTINSLVLPAPATFTPVVADAASGGNVATTSSSSGIWQRVGNIVYFSMRILNINTTGLTAGNTLNVRGLPVPVRGGTNSTLNASLRMDGITFTFPPTAFADDGDTHMIFYEPLLGTSPALITVSDVASGTADLWISGWYFA